MVAANKPRVRPSYSFYCGGFFCIKGEFCDLQVLINPHHAARPDLLEVTAYSPTHRPLGCPVSEDNGTFYASFQPDEAGEWKIHVTYDDEDIENSPFKCMVFDPRAIHVRRPSNDGSI